MPDESRANGPTLPRPLRVLFAPALVLERTRGRKRIALATLYSLLIVAAGAWLWRESRLWRLPDIDDAPGVQRLLAIQVPSDQNAFVLYQEANDRLKRDMTVERETFNGSYDWSKTDDAGRAYMARNAEALTLWRQGCERSDALYIPARDVTLDMRLDLVQEHRQFARMALLEASRLEQSGDKAGAWGWYRAALRGSRLVGRHGSIIGALVGVAEYGMVASRVSAWAADPKVEAPLLREAMADIRRLNDLTAPLSESLLYEYCWSMASLEDTDEVLDYLLESEGSANLVDKTAWHNHLRTPRRAIWFLNHEPERSRRVLRLAYANWLAHCDDPPAHRPPLDRSYDPPLLFDVPVSSGQPSPHELAEMIDASLLSKTFVPFFSGTTAVFDRDRNQRLSLLVSLADQLYLREHGHPADAPSELVRAGYIDRLPDGYEESDDDRND